MKKKQYRMDASRKWCAGAKLCGPSSSAAQARERMLQRQRRDSEELPGGPKQTDAPSAEAARAAMIERSEKTPERQQAATVEELLRLFKNGKLTPQEAYNRFLALGDESKMTTKQAKAYFFGREDSAGARERMLHRMGLNR